jgi:hypothetical protein
MPRSMVTVREERSNSNGPGNQCTKGRIGVPHIRFADMQELATSRIQIHFLYQGCVMEEIQMVYDAKIVGTMHNAWCRWGKSICSGIEPLHCGDIAHGAVERRKLLQEAICANDMQHGGRWACWRLFPGTYRATSSKQKQRDEGKEQSFCFHWILLSVKKLYRPISGLWIKRETILFCSGNPPSHACIFMPASSCLYLAARPALCYNPG